jgi:dTDP-4-dehydrorhamnose reductase
MRILLLGYLGQLGWELRRTLAPLGPLAALDYPEIDLGSPDAVRDHIRRLSPEVIVNATAYTAVDRAEDEAPLALAINGRAPEVMAEEARRLGAALIHYSTDYVFDGTKGEPYVEGDRPNPLSVYGSTKLVGERAVAAAGGAHLILRTSWVYSLRRPSFVTKVLSWARKNRSLRIVTDQVSNPTWCRMLAEATAQVLACGGGNAAAWLSEHSGLYHLAGSGFASRFDWARAILALDPDKGEQLAEEVLPAASADFPTPAARPAFSALDCGRFQQTFGLALPPWESALQLAMEGE